MTSFSSSFIFSGKFPQVFFSLSSPTSFYKTNQLTLSVPEYLVALSPNRRRREGTLKIYKLVDNFDGHILDLSKSVEV